MYFLHAGREEGGRFGKRHLAPARSEERRFRPVTVVEGGDAWQKSATPSKEGETSYVLLTARAR